MPDDATLRPLGPEDDLGGARVRDGLLVPGDDITVYRKPLIGWWRPVPEEGARLENRERILVVRGGLWVKPSEAFAEGGPGYGRATYVADANLGRWERLGLGVSRAVGSLAFLVIASVLVVQVVAPVADTDGRAAQTRTKDWDRMRLDIQKAWREGAIPLKGVAKERVQSRIDTFRQGRNQPAETAR